MLLGLEAVHVDRQLGRRDHIGKEDELPTDKLRAVTEVEVFGQRVMLPPAGFLNAGAAPKSRGAIKVEKTTAPTACGLFEQQVTVEEHCLHFCEQGVGAIKMSPTRLDHPDLRIREVMNGALQEVRLRDKIGVENA